MNLKAILFLSLATTTGFVLVFFNFNQTNPPASISAQISKAEIIYDQPIKLNDSPLPAPQAIQGLNAVEQQNMAEITQSFKAGDYQQTLKKAREALAKEHLTQGYKAWINHQMPSILTSFSWILIQQSKCAEALPLLEESKKRAPMLETTKGLAYCHYKMKSFNLAEEEMLTYRKAAKSDPDMSMVFADILESQGRFEEATEILDYLATDAEASKNINDQVQKQLSSMRAKLKESYNQATVSTDHFIISYRLPDHEPLINTAMESLESALTEYVDFWGLNYPAQTLEVLLYPETNFGHLVSYGPKWAKGIYDGRLRIQINPSYLDGSDAKSFVALLRHELVHALVAEKTDRRALPDWLNEGAAMFLECAGGCEKVGFHTLGGRFTSKENFSKKYTELSTAEASVMYKQSLYLVQTLDQNYRMGDSRPLGMILSNLSPQSPLMSDDLLKNLNLTFEQLYQKTKSDWDIKIAKDRD